MNTKRQKYRTGGFRIWWLALCALAAGCTAEPAETAGAERESGQALVRLTIRTPQSALPRAATRSSGAFQANPESRIGTVRILAFKKSAGDYRFEYMVEGRRVEAVENDMTRFDALLTTSPDPLRLEIVANAEAAFGTFTPQSGMSGAEVRAGLSGSFSGLEGRDLPMFGRIDLDRGLNASSENGLSAVMLRAVARADVVRALDSGSERFRMTSLYVFRANERYQAIPDEMTGTDYPLVRRPSVPAGSALMPQPVVPAPAGSSETERFTNVYLPEAESRDDPAARLTGVTCLVVGGYYKDDGTESFYRIDFDPGLDGHPFGQILRNHRYEFRIVRVLGRGWDDPQTAADSKASSIVAEMQPWEDFTTEMFFEGDNYLGVSGREAVLRYPEGSRRQLGVQSSVPFRIRWLDEGGQPAGGTASNVEEALTADTAFRVEIVREAGDAPDEYRLDFTALRENGGSAETVRTLRMTGGKWYFDIRVRQESFSKYAGRVIRVMSVPEVGDLGTPDPVDASGRALRNLLDNRSNFSDTGTVRIGGFAFVECARIMMSSTGTGAALDKARFDALRSTVYGQDVIYLSYNTPLSAEAAGLVYGWLRSAKNRVLIVGTDSKTTNLNLLPYLSADGSWNYYNVKNIGGAFARAPETEQSRRFFERPFGRIPEGAPMRRTDDVAGYNADYPAGVVPLIVSDKAEYGRYMIVGVNPADRIVYHGDASLNLLGPMSSAAQTDGTIGNDLDRLHANLWAWIVEQVCAEE